jgi:hypothetical protein
MLFRLLAIVGALLFVTPAARADFDFGEIQCETTTTTGTGTLNLAGALSNYTTFLSQVDTGDTVPYHIRASDGKLEVGVGTFTDATPDTLSRVATWSTDGSGAELTLPAGTHNVCIGPIAGMQYSWLNSVAPGTDNAFDIGTASLGIRDIFITSDIELGGGTATSLTEGTAAGMATIEGKPILTVIGVQAFTSGDGTYTPTAGTKFVKATCTGEGGGGGGSDDDGGVNSTGVGGGGEGAGTAIIWYDLTELGADAAYSIGDGGGGGGSGTNGTDGTDGDDTTFNPAGTGLTITGAGGDGGTGSGVATLVILGNGGSAEGVATNGDVNIPGTQGAGGSATQDGTNAIGGSGGHGGGSYWGPGASGSVENTSSGIDTGNTAEAPGAGGQGGISVDTGGTGGGGGAGANGICVVEEFGS